MTSTFIYDNSNSIATSSIRQKLRNKIRNQQIQNSFSKTRQQNLAQQQKQKLHSKHKRNYLQTNPFKINPNNQIVKQNKQKYQKQPYLQQENQNYNQNLYGTNNMNHNNKKQYTQQDYNKIWQYINQVGKLGNLHNIRPYMNVNYYNGLDIQKQRKYVNPNDNKNNLICTPTTINPNNQFNNTKNIQNPIPQMLNYCKNQQLIPKNDRKTVQFKHQNYLVYNEVLGTGTFSTVYLGYNLITGKEVAIKQLNQIQKNQINVLKSIQSPYIIRLQHHWQYKNKNKTYLVLDLCECNLREQIKKNISLQKKLKYYQHVLKGMDILFSYNIIHRDLKFQNILIGQDEIAKISDFGLAKDLGQMTNVASVRCGTPYTMAPQIYFHNPGTKTYYNQKCDIWSLAVLLHQILYQKHPFSLEPSRMYIMDRVYIKKNYGFLDTLLDKALVKDPNYRVSWDQFKRLYELGRNFTKVNRNMIKHLPQNKQDMVCISSSKNKLQIRQISQQKQKKPKQNKKQQNIIQLINKEHQQNNYQNIKLNQEKIPFALYQNDLIKNNQKFNKNIKQPCLQPLIIKFKQKFQKQNKIQTQERQRFQRLIEKQEKQQKQRKQRQNQLQKQRQKQGQQQLQNIRRKQKEEQTDPLKIFNRIFKQPLIKPNGQYRLNTRAITPSSFPKLVNKNKSIITIKPQVIRKGAQTIQLNGVHLSNQQKYSKKQSNTFLKLLFFFILLMSTWTFWNMSKA